MRLSERTAGPAQSAGSLSTSAMRTDAVLNAAVAEFLAKGYERANLRSIVAASGRSTGDVYRRFGNKEALFREVINRHIDLSLPRTARLRPGEGSMEEGLAVFATAYLTDLMDPEALAIFRMCVAQAAIFPDVVHRLWEAGPRKAIDHVETYLLYYRDSGLIEVDDPHLAAAQFLDMVKAGFHIRQLMGGVAPTPSEIERSACQAARIFTSGLLRSKPLK